MHRHRVMRLSGELLILLGLVLLAWAVLEGQASFALLFVIPVLYGSGPLVAIAALMVFGGAVLVFLSFFKAPAGKDTIASPGRAEREWGGVILIGPVPIVIGSAGMLKGRGAIVLLAALSVLVLLFFLFNFQR
jgi:uncharacterized membrane protein